MNRVIIYTGPVHSGKSSRLKVWCDRRDDVAGILTPMAGGKRYLYLIREKERRAFEAPAARRDAVKIGRYRFLPEAFEQARRVLLKALLYLPRWLVIDEVGPLELQRKGLEPVLSEVLQRAADKGIDVLLVVRGKLVDKVTGYYNIKPAKIIEDPDGLSSL